MKKLLTIIALMGFINICAVAGQSKEYEKQLMTEANQIVNALNLDNSKEKLVYNVLYHVKTRLEDLALGTPNYDRLVSYIDQERTEMMKVILPSSTYEKYARMYNSAEEKKIQKLKEINKEYINSAMSKDIEANVLMKKDQILSE